jgi:hypothetical protein
MNQIVMLTKCVQLGGVMGLLPMSSSPICVYDMCKLRHHMIKVAGAVMIAKVLHAYGSHLLQCEEKSKSTCYCHFPLEDLVLISKVLETALQHRVDTASLTVTKSRWDSLQQNNYKAHS